MSVCDRMKGEEETFPFRTVPRVRAQANIKTDRSPSTGLLEHPEDAIYYEWILHDATEAPFATFCFHYRAWTYLWDLNLVTDNGNSLLHNTRLWERLGRSRHKATAYGKLKDESEATQVGLDLGHYSKGDDIRVTAPRASRAHFHSQGIIQPNEEPHLLEVYSGLLSRGKTVTSSSATPSRRFSHSYAHLATLLLLPPVVEEDIFTGSESREHETIAVSPTHSYSRESLCSRFRRPLPTVNEIPRLE